MAEHTARGRPHMGCSFELLTEDFRAACIRDTVRRLQAQMTQGWPCWAISDHDVERVLSRWGNGDASAQLANLFRAVACSLRGSVCIYQGEEPGLTEADVPYESLRDPYGIAFWPQFKGRDGCRTPMPWSDTDAQAGFSHGMPWLPVPEEHRARGRAAAGRSAFRVERISRVHALAASATRVALGRDRVHRDGRAGVGLHSPV